MFKIKVANFAGEREAAQRKQAKAEKKIQKELTQKRLGINKESKKSRKGGIRIKKGVTIKVSHLRLRSEHCKLRECNQIYSHQTCR